MLARSVDPATGIIYVLASGEWDDDKIDEHFHKMRPLLAERRAAGMPIMVLIDVRDAPRPSDATRLKLKAGAASTYKLGDRVVLVALDATMKDDVRNFLVGEGVWSYCSMIAAEQWLLMQTD